MSEDREKELPLLIQGYKKEIWEWKQKESKWILDQNKLDGHKRIVEELSQKIMDLSAEIKELSTKLIEMAKVNLALKKRVQEAEGETAIVKGIGINSPEMRDAQAKLKEAGEINMLHQELNGKLQTRLTEVEEDNKKLAKQIQDLNNRLSL